MKWEIWRRWSETRPFDDLEDLTEDQVTWVEMQTQIDAGLRHCEPCDRFGHQTFCGHCGRRYYGADRSWRACSRCHTQGTTEYCQACGYHVVPAYLQRFEAGTEDHAANERAAGDVLRQMLSQDVRLAEMLGSAAEEAPVNLAEALASEFGGRNGD